MYKFFLMIVAGLLFCQNTFSQNVGEVIISGIAKEEGVKQIVLRHVVDGRWVEYADTEVNDKGEFSFKFKPNKEGFWSIGNKEKKRFYDPQIIRLYVKPSDKIKIEIGEKQNYSFLNKASKENTLLMKWNLMFSNIFGGFRADYDKFFPTVKGLLKESNKFKKKIRCKNQEFEKLMRSCVELDIKHGLLRYLFSPHSKHPKVSEHPLIYKEIVNSEKFDDSRILLLPVGSSYISKIIMYRMIHGGAKVAGNKFLDWQIKNISNNALKGVCFIDNLKYFKQYSTFERAYSKYKQFITTDYQKEQIKKYIAKNSAYKEGQPSIDFTYPDKDGNNHSLSDYKGKVVLVDIWATWCGPCKAEIPHLQKLEKEYHGKDVVFISVSVDKEKSKWLKMLNDKKLTGIQLWANGWSKITKDYLVKGVPRFLLFDKEGNIITINAPRPSDIYLKELIDKYL